MSNEDSRPLHLRRVDPSQDMWRFYAVSLQTTLFGEISLIRNWGRIGARGQSMIETFDHTDAAQRTFSPLVRTKRRRGYNDDDPARSG